MFDAKGIIDADGNTGEVLVGAGVWIGEQLNVTAVSSIDLSAFGGPILPGSINGNELSVKVWVSSENVEYDATYNIFSGLVCVRTAIRPCT